MCGVFGWIGSPDDWRDAHRLLPSLAAAHEARGRDAAGWAALNRRGDLAWQRRPGPAGALFEGHEFRALRRRRIIMAIGHARHATAGAPAVNGNNHPHLAGKAGANWGWGLVHNGCVRHHHAVAAVHGLHLTSECDSEVLARLLANYGERRGPEICLALEGNQSVLAIDSRRRRLVVWTDGEMPLVAFRVEGIGGLWWASTREIARKALAPTGLEGRFADAVPGTIYRLEPRDAEVVMEADRVWEPAA